MPLHVQGILLKDALKCAHKVQLFCSSTVQDSLQSEHSVLKSTPGMLLLCLHVDCLQFTLPGTGDSLKGIQSHSQVSAVPNILLTNS